MAGASSAGTNITRTSSLVTVTSVICCLPSVKRRNARLPRGRLDAGQIQLICHKIAAMNERNDSYMGRTSS
ncbi:hypothetical protein E2C01_038226 [Portunus trituberculatus]|uniref:Uncharacterized protein n=1 Tax=Portunus trituberculatus TaxID=210409 RepID=A0A5B7FBN3_PORTR|nr:hypothetical protein [Portunus trituberculatus]